MRVKKEPYFILPKPIIVEPRSQFAIMASTKSLTSAVTEEAGLDGLSLRPEVEADCQGKGRELNGSVM